MDKSNKEKTILSLCSGTGAWERPYVVNGYNVISVTLPECDVRTYKPPENVYGILAAPPCTMFSDARTSAKTPRDLKGGMEIILACLNIIYECQYKISHDQSKKSPLSFWALENPWYGRLKWFLGKPALVFNPYDYGDGYQKKTALWGWFNEPKKNPVLLISEMKELAKKNNYLHTIGTKFDMLKTKEIHPEFYGRFDRQTRRAITPAGFAKAFFKANQ